MAKNLILGPILACLDIVTSYHCKQFKENVCSKLNKMEKSHFGPDLGLLGPNPGCQFFFKKNLASSVTRYHGQLSSCIMSEKTNDSILGKLEKKTDGQTD